MMDKEQITMATILSRCTFQPGSYQKRFARAMLAHAALKPDEPLTDKQGEYLARLFHMYRKQIGSLDHNLHCQLCNRALDALQLPLRSAR